MLLLGKNTPSPSNIDFCMPARAHRHAHTYTKNEVALASWMHIGELNF